MSDAIRLDRFFWHACLAATRALAHALATEGLVRIDGRPTGKEAAMVRVGAVLTYADHGGAIRSLRIEELPARRGPPAEARACFTDLIDASAPAT